MKKILILGGGHAEIPLIKSAKELGYYVITTGNKENDIGHKYADEYIKADFSDIQKMYEIAKKLEIDAICPCANDYALISCSYIAQNMGFENYDSYETSLIIHHKDKFRSFALENNLSVPNAKSFDNVNSLIESINNFKLPIIIKPIDLSGGKGIQKIQISNVEKLKQIVSHIFSISKEKKVIVEEFIEGSNHGLSCILINKKIKFYFCDNEHYYINKYMVSGASYPSDVPQKVIDQLINESEKIANLLNLKDGIFHIQFILKKDKAYIIEICRRPPGDLYIDFVKYSTGIDYPKYLIKAFCGLNISDLEQKDYNFITRHCIMTNKNGILNNITYDEALKKNILGELIWGKKGDKIEDFRTYKAGIIFLKYNSQEEMKEKVKLLNSLITIEMEETTKIKVTK